MSASYNKTTDGKKNGVYTRLPSHKHTLVYVSVDFHICTKIIILNTIGAIIDSWGIPDHVYIFSQLS